VHRNHNLRFVAAGHPEILAEGREPQNRRLSHRLLTKSAAMSCRTTADAMKPPPLGTINFGCRSVKASHFRTGGRIR